MRDFGKGTVYSSAIAKGSDKFPVFKFKAKKSVGIHNGLEHLDIVEGTEYSMLFKDVNCFQNLVSFDVIEPIARLK